MTLGDLKAQVKNWMRENVDASLLADAVNDAIESLAQSIIITRIESLMGGTINPVSFSIASGAERVQLVSIPDPILVPTLYTIADPAYTLINQILVAWTYVTESGSETKIGPTVTAIRAGAPGVKYAVVAPPYVAGAIGWNLYASPTNSINNMALQNDTPMPFVDWIEPPSGVIAAPDLPLPPNNNTTGDNIFFLNHLEVQMPDGTYKSWNEAEINSEMMRRAARTISSTSPYQNYFWDLLGDQLEIRPALGTSYNPRYFYAAKPRRLAFDNAPIPFTNVACVAFIRCFAVSLLKLAFEEYQASQAWGQKAEVERMNIMKSLTVQNRNRNSSITPFLQQ